MSKDEEIAQLKESLTVERERGNAYERQLIETGKQLAAERDAKMEWAKSCQQLRESRDGFRRALEQRIAEINQLRAQLAAERDAGYEECRELWQQDVQQLAAAVEAIAWLNEFVVEPEYFPAEGDRYWWQEKRAALAKIGEK